MPTPHRKSRGFVITTTLVLVLTVVVIGLFAGLAAVRNAWFKKMTFETSVEVFVSDQNDVILGKAVDYDEHEAPLVPFVDYDVPAGSGSNYRVLVGIRDDRFSSREKVYYTTDNCTLGGTDVACMFQPSTEVSGAATINSEDVDMLTGTGGVSYQIATQGSINYAIGSTDGGLPGRLYRQSAATCDLTTTQNISSYWMSQAVVSQGGTDSGGGATNPPCYEVQFFVNEVTTRVRCQPGTAINAPGAERCVGPLEGNPFCRTNGVRCALPGDANWGGAQFGACPQTVDGNWELFPPGNNSGFCCPPGTTSAGGAGQCQRLVNNLPTGGTFFQAESVGGATNVLDNLTPPFQVNLPIDPDGFATVNPIVGEN